MFHRNNVSMAHLIEWCFRLASLLKASEDAGDLRACYLELVSGAFQRDLRNPKYWHNLYMIFWIGFVKKISNYLKIVTSIFFSFLDTLLKQKDFFHFWAKNNLLLCFICSEGYMSIWPRKSVFKGFYKMSLKCS